MKIYQSEFKKCQIIKNFKFLPMGQYFEKSRHTVLSIISSKFVRSRVILKPFHRLMEITVWPDLANFHLFGTIF